DSFGVFISAAELRLNPAWDSIRNLPRFQALQARLDADPRFSPAVEAQPSATPAAIDEKSVAVLPFANLSGDTAQEYFSDGLTEEILSALTRERDLRVVPRTSAFSFKAKNLPLPEIARALHVAQIVEGSVQRAGNRVRIRCTVTRVADGFAVPLPAFDRELKDGTDIFALEDEVARAVVEKLTQRTTTTVPIAVLTKDSDAYDAYLHGRQLMNQTSPFWPKAVEAFRRAVELDPQFALAWAELGRLSASLYASGFDGAALAASERAIAEAVRLQPDLPEAHLARAFYLRITDAPPEAVERELAAAERMRPDAPEIVEFRSSVEFARGDEEQGLKLMQRAVDLDPRNGARLNTLGNELTSAGRYAEAEAIYRQSFQILSSSVPLTNRAGLYVHWKADRALAARTLDEAPEGIRGDRYWTTRALLLYYTGDQPGALAAAAHMKPRSEFFRIRAFFTAKMREAMGDAAGAQQDYLTALPLAEQQRDEFSALPEPHAILGLIYAGLGRKAEALAAVHKAIEGYQPGAIAGSTTGRPGLARKGASALSSLDLEIEPLVAFAQVHARFGLMDDALALVQAATATGRLRRNYLLLSPDWAILRKDPRFRAIAEKAPL
ncbi:MAG: invasion protein regulator, partial [Lacunisphaera sp.]|nr:invasion protein regulator [Lacunisphaera sp.]